MANSISTAPSSPSRNKALLLNCISNGVLFQDILKEWTGDPNCCHTSSYCWSVQNKYYSTSITLQSYSPLEAEALAFRIEDEHYEAVIIFLDCTQADDTLVEKLEWGWADVSRQLKKSMQEGCGMLPDVRLLLGVVGGEVEREGAGLQKVLEWSVKEGFELIKWSASCQLQEEEGEEVGGSVRLSQALQAHVWPEMNMRSRTLCEQQQMPSDLKHHESSPPDSSGNSAEAVRAEGQESTQDPGGEEFEHLFARFADMKAHADQLSHEEKKQYAEKVVMAFWTAIGGDEGEMQETL